ncbi:MAG: 4-carboxymuconolactone decarboxylase [Cellvibrionaceae bacterium]|jgi:4-carboxymuconolactone decarboxylase
MNNKKYEEGIKTRRAVLGDAHVDRATANATEFDAGFQRFITEFAWGTAWQGDELDVQTRHLVTIAIIAALGKEHELAMHIRATKNTGVTPDQIAAVMNHVAIYAGVPAANTAIGIAKEIYADASAGSETEKD